jgi:hypothetical protein
LLASFRKHHALAKKEGAQPNNSRPSCCKQTT